MLLGWLAAESTLAHPDTIGYFNALAGAHPERIVIDSDLDWRQGMIELERLVAKHHIEKLRLHYFGTADITQHPLPPPPGENDLEYWTAISTTTLSSIEGFDKFRNCEPDAATSDIAFLLLGIVLLLLSFRLKKSRLGQ
jgi:hypothetical protein